MLWEDTKTIQNLNAMGTRQNNLKTQNNGGSIYKSEAPMKLEVKSVVCGMIWKINGDIKIMST